MTSNTPLVPALPGDAHLSYRDGQLCMEGVRLADLARAHGTPLFVYSSAAIVDALAAYQRGLAGRRSLICYALKANSTLAVLRVFADAGCGFDIVSGGELERVLVAGGAPGKIVFSGIGKTRAEMARALQAGIGCFNVESLAELDVLSEVAVAQGQRAPISIRVNPNVDPKTHPYISTGLKGNKFGIAHEQALGAYQRAAGLPGLRVVGIDCHIGSQITDIEPYLEAVDRLLDLVAQVEQAGIPIAHIDIGGGLGIRYEDEVPPAADELMRRVVARLDERGYGERELLIEPGRSLVGNAGVLLAEVLVLKPGADDDTAGSSPGFCIVDAAMNDLARPAMYQAWMRIEPCLRRGGAAPLWDVVGPVCESGDWLGRQRALAVQPGDRIAVLSAGAYGMSMASNYNSRPRAAEVLVERDQSWLIRERETVDQLFAGERLLP